MRIRTLAFMMVLNVTSLGLAAEPTSDCVTIVFETRIVAVPVSSPCAKLSAKEGEVTVLSDEELRSTLEALLADRQARVTQTPRVTVADGQVASIVATQQQSFMTGMELKRVNGVPMVVPKPSMVETGMRLSLRGTRSDDKGHVLTSINYKDMQVADRIELIPITTQVIPIFEGGSQGMPIPVTQYLQSPEIKTITIEKAELPIPSGGHVLIAGPRYAHEVRQETNVDGLADLPIVGRMFRQVSYSKAHVLIILSARTVEPLPIASPTASKP